MTQLTLRAMMLWLGFIQDAADKLFDGQEIDSIDEWLKLVYDNVNTLLWNVRKPGSGRQGEMISFKADINIHLTVFFARHKYYTSWSMDYSDISVPNICAMRKQQEMESDKEKNPKYPTIDLKDISKTFEAMIQYLCGIHVCDGVPPR